LKRTVGLTLGVRAAPHVEREAYDFEIVPVEVVQ
jgi:hypothetical protein